MTSDGDECANDVMLRSVVMTGDGDDQNIDGSWWYDLKRERW